MADYDFGGVVIGFAISVGVVCLAFGIGAGVGFVAGSAVKVMTTVHLEK